MSNSKHPSKKNNSVCAIVPFFNEKTTLSMLLDETLKYVDKVFAINDGSSDDTYNFERSKINITMIDLEKNYGKGRALSIGFEEALASGFENIVTVDADFQHNPKYIPELLEALNSFEIVIGNRLKNLKNMPVQRKISNTLTSYFLTKKTGQKILDSQCGFRAYRAEVLKKVKTKYYGFEAESEIIVKAAKEGFNIGFIDISTIYGNEKSKMKPVQAILGFLKVLLLN